MATLGGGDKLGWGDALGDGLGNLDLLGRWDTRWTSLGGLVVTPCPLVDGLGER